jgi:phosphopantothenoylcysteine synthetase/decarboxylase
MKILLTSGGTKVKIDRVRHIGNMSHGTFGSAIAKHLLSWEDVNLTFLYSEHSNTPFTYSVN